MGKSIMAYETVIALGERLKAVCQKIDGFAVYETGWDDARIAAELSVTITNVRGLREKIIGLVRPARPGTIEKRLEALETWAAARPVAPFKR